MARAAKRMDIGYIFGGSRAGDPCTVFLIRFPARKGQIDARPSADPHHHPAQSSGRERPRLRTR